ncbi:MAG: hypothetical protein IJF03_01645 [Lachnospiraceae bacterium]|nr:hypothetical protein [Lachnospiraceae bacterium]
MRKKRNIVIFATIFVVVVLPIMLYFSRNKILITVNVKLNGEPINLDEAKTNCTYAPDENCEYTYAEGTFEIKNVESSGYQLTLVVPKEKLKGYKEDLIIQLEYVNPKQNVTSKSQCELDIKTSNEGLYGSYDINLVRRTGNEQYTGNVEPHNNTIELYWGL